MFPTLSRRCGSGNRPFNIYKEAWPVRKCTILEYYALLTALKKWTFALSMPGVASRWHIFEANVNGFTLVLQAHGAKPLDDRAEQTLV